MSETYGIYKTPHLEKYQSDDSETSDIMQATWNFGNELKGKGFAVAYMHGPIGIYEGVTLTAQVFLFTVKDQLKEFIETCDEKGKWQTPIKDCVIFLYQKLSNRLRYTVLSKEFILENRKNFPKKKKKVVDKSK